MTPRPSNASAKPVSGDASAITELTVAELAMVTGGLNPQPLPPHVDPDMRA